MAHGQGLAAPAREAPLTQVAKVVGVFVAVGIGLGAATLIFLEATGFFDVASSQGPDALATAFFGAVGVWIVQVFALLVGTVLAALGGVYVSRVAASRGMAAAAGAIAGVLGHIGLAVTLGLFLIIGIEALDGPDEATAAPTPAPVVTRSPEEIAECFQVFGEGSPACAQPTPTPTEETTGDDGTGVSFEDMMRVGLGLMPAGLVGGLAGAILFRRRYQVDSMGPDVPFVAAAPAIDVEPDVEPDVAPALEPDVEPELEPDHEVLDEEPQEDEDVEEEDVVPARKKRTRRGT